VAIVSSVVPVIGLYWLLSLVGWLAVNSGTVEVFQGLEEELMCLGWCLGSVCLYHWEW
jgi:hypothetical protein